MYLYCTRYVSNKAHCSRLGVGSPRWRSHGTSKDRLLVYEFGVFMAEIYQSVLVLFAEGLTILDEAQEPRIKF